MTKKSELVLALASLAQRLAELIEEKSPTIDASIYQARIRCGRNGCRCMSSTHRHSMWCLSRVKDGKSMTRTVPEEALTEVRKMCLAHRELRALRRELQSLSKKVTGLLDQHGEAMAKRGWRRFEAIKEAGK